MSTNNQFYYPPTNFKPNEYSLILIIILIIKIILKKKKFLDANGNTLYGGQLLFWNCQAQNANSISQVPSMASHVDLNNVASTLGTQPIFNGIEEQSATMFSGNILFFFLFCLKYFIIFNIKFYLGPNSGINAGFFSINSNNLYINHEEQQNLNQLNDYYGSMQQNNFLAARLNNEINDSCDTQIRNTRSTPTSPIQSCINTDKLLIHDTKPISSAVFERNHSNESTGTNGSTTIKSSSGTRFKKCNYFKSIVFK